jgi:TPR repeat protein
LDKEAYEKRERERIEANDPEVLRYRGSKCYQAGDYDKAVEYWTKAAELGNAEAHYQLGCTYGNGEGVEKNEEKAVYHYEKAAIGGHPIARHNLGCHEQGNGNMERAVKHWIIAAKLGDEDSMKALLPNYKEGYISKEEYGATLRTHQAAVDATKSAQREKALSKIGK